MDFELHSDWTILYPDKPSSTRFILLLINSRIDSASSSKLPSSTKTPFSPLVIVNGIPCVLVLITAFLNANPSRGVYGDNSQREGKTRNSDSLYAAITSSLLGFVKTLILFSILNSLII